MAGKLLSKPWVWAGAGAAAVALITGGYFGLRTPIAYGRIAVTYAAKQTCTCVNVAERSLESCLSDFPEDARAHIKLSVSGNHVRASAFGLISAEASYEPEFGCRIDD